MIFPLQSKVYSCWHPRLFLCSYLHLSENYVFSSPFNSMNSLRMLTSQWLSEAHQTDSDHKAVWREILIIGPIQTRQGIAFFKLSFLYTNLIYMFLSFRKQDNLKNNLLFISHTPNTRMHCWIFFWRIMKQKENGNEMRIIDAYIRLPVYHCC